MGKAEIRTTECGAEESAPTAKGLANGSAFGCGNDHVRFGSGKSITGSGFTHGTMTLPKMPPPDMTA